MHLLHDVIVRADAANPMHDVANDFLWDYLQTSEECLSVCS
jgi:hypothetical protein